MTLREFVARNRSEKLILWFGSDQAPLTTLMGLGHDAARDRDSLTRFGDLKGAVVDGEWHWDEQGMAPWDSHTHDVIEMVCYANPALWDEIRAGLAASV